MKKLWSSTGLKRVLSESERVGMEKKEVQEIRAMLKAQQNSILKQIASLLPNSPEQQRGLSGLHNTQQVFPRIGGQPNAEIQCYRSRKLRERSSDSKIPQHRSDRA